MLKIILERLVIKHCEKDRFFQACIKILCLKNQFYAFRINKVLMYITNIQIKIDNMVIKASCLFLS